MSTSPVTRGLTPEDIQKVSPALGRYTGQAIVGDLWNRPQLSRRERGLATLSALITKGQTIGLPHYVGLSLESGVKPSEISEVVLQVAFYAGWSNAFTAIEVLKDLFEERGITADHLPDESQALLDIKVALPDEAIRSAFIAAEVAPIAPAFADFTDDLLYHEVWLRPHLSPRDRGIVTVSSLIASGSTQFLPMYLGRTLGHGLTKEQAGELLTHLAFYVGWPNVVAAIGAAKDLLK